MDASASACAGAQAAVTQTNTSNMASFISPLRGFSQRANATFVSNPIGDPRSRSDCSAEVCHRNRNPIPGQGIASELHWNSDSKAFQVRYLARSNTERSVKPSRSASSGYFWQSRQKFFRAREIGQLGQSRDNHRSSSSVEVCGR